MKNKKTLITAVMAIMALTALTVGSLALFTDRFQADVDVTAGTLDLVLEQNWVSENSTVAANFKPGTALVLDYTLRNGGNLASNVKEKIVISTDKDLTDSAPEFAIYSADDVNVAADGTYTFKSGAAPLASTPGTYAVTNGTGSVSWHKLTYEIPQFVLDGNTEKIDGVETQKKEGAYVLVFSTNADNDFQAANLKIEYMAQGLQHGNTDNNTWNDDRVVSATVTFGGEEVEVVPDLPAVNP